MSKFTTDQEQFWASDFGSQYIERNQGNQLLASNLDFFGKALRHAREVKSCLEFGSNIGMNLKALKLLFPDQDQYAIEINAKAATRLAETIPASQIYQQSIFEFIPERQWDLVLIKGVLIHLNPDKLLQAYEKLVQSTSRYLLIAEYYNPSPVAIPYRGHVDRLFKRDFAGEIIDLYRNMTLIDYGFAYHRDPNFPQDDITWFLLEKTSLKAWDPT
jgi:pseudaminic acid biosynthesis-associated methylase